MSIDKKSDSSAEVPEIVELDEFKPKAKGAEAAAIKRPKPVPATQQFTQEDLAELQRYAQEHNENLNPLEDLGDDPEEEERIIEELLRETAVMQALGIDDGEDEDDGDVAFEQALERMRAVEKAPQKHARVRLTPDEFNKLRQIADERNLPGQHSPIQVLPKLESPIEAPPTPPTPTTPKAVRRSTRENIRRALIIIGFAAATGGAALATVRIKSCVQEKPAAHKSASGEE